MKILKLQRTLKEGFSNFVRNGWLSVATISVISISLLILGFTLSIGMAAKDILRETQDKLSVSIYFKENVTEERILAIKREIDEKQYAEVKSIEYVSKEQALEELLRIDPSIQKAVDEVGGNPLLPSLEIRANQTDQYEIIARKFQNDFKDEVSRVNYEKNRELIERVDGKIRSDERRGIFLGSIFILLSFLITFNTIRMTIYFHKQEFEIMRLVGASNLYVQMPFFFEGILYGIGASLVAASLLLAYNFIGGRTLAFTGMGWLEAGIVFLALLVVGTGLGALSSLIAIRRYLKK